MPAFWRDVQMDFSFDCLFIDMLVPKIEVTTKPVREKSGNNCFIYTLTYFHISTLINPPTADLLFLPHEF